MHRLPEPLVESLRAQLAIARSHFDSDRAPPGVHLPFALETNYPNAGKTWAWFWAFPAKGLSNVENAHRHILQLLLE